MVNAMTLRAPADLRERRASRSVAPVVATSSMRMMLRPETTAASAAKQPRKLSSRFARLSVFVWLGVSFIFVSARERVKLRPPRLPACAEVSAGKEDLALLEDTTTPALRPPPLTLGGVEGEIKH